MKAILALAIVTASIFAGCATPTTGGTTPELKDGKYIIHLTAANMMTPVNAKVPLGATVQWINDSGVHDVTADDGSFNSDTTVGHKMKSGESFEHTFSTAGTFTYSCTIHASTGMKGTLTVA